jgi:hypothetical protein
MSSELDLNRHGALANEVSFGPSLMKSQSGRAGYTDYVLLGIAGRPMHDGLSCVAHACGCRFDSFVWVSHSRKAIWFETPKTASSSIKQVLGVRSPTLGAEVFKDGSEHLRVTLPTAFAEEIEGALGLHRFTNWVIATIGEVEREAIFREWGGDGACLLLEEACRRTAAELRGEPMELYEKIVQSAWPGYGPEAGFAPYFGGVGRVIEDYGDYMKFACVRSPLGRLVSSWRMFSAGEGESPTVRKAECLRTFGIGPSDLDFHLFVELALKTPNHHYAPLEHLLPVRDGKVVVDWLIPINELERSWKTVASLLDLGQPLPVRNTTRHGPVENYFDLPLRRRVENAYAAEFELLGHLY